MWLVMVLLVAAFARADLDVELHMTTNDGDIDAWLYPNSGTGETNYYLGDKNLESELVRIEAAGGSDSIEWYLQSFYSLFMRRNTNDRTIWEITPISTLDRHALKFRLIFDRYFVPRTEVNEMLEEKDDAISQLELRIMALENLFSEEEICNARMNVVKELDLDAVTCGDIKYFNHLPDNEFIGLREVESNYTYKPIEVEAPVRRNITQELEVKWTRLCEMGLIQFCAKGTE